MASVPGFFPLDLCATNPSYVSDLGGSSLPESIKVELVGVEKGDFKPNRSSVVTL